MTSGASLRRSARVAVGGAVVGLVLLVGAGAAHAQTSDPYNSQPPTSVESEHTVTVPVTTSATTTSATVTSSSALPVTGADVAELALIGGGLVLAGGGLVVARRRRQA